MSRLDSLDNLVLFNIATMLDIDGLLSFCKSSEKINRLICQKDTIWKKFHDWEKDLSGMKGKDIYILLDRLNTLRRKIGFSGSIHKLYNLKALSLEQRDIKNIPPEINTLHKLEELYLFGNKIKIIPPEIGDLNNLRNLYLHHNEIENIPLEIGKLKNLRILDLGYNKITFLPVTLANLNKIESIYLNGNKIKTIPIELKHLPIVRQRKHMLGW